MQRRSVDSLGATEEAAQSGAEEPPENAAKEALERIASIVRTEDAELVAETAAEVEAWIAAAVQKRTSLSGNDEADAAVKPEQDVAEIERKIEKERLAAEAAAQVALDCIANIVKMEDEKLAAETEADGEKPPTAEMQTEVEFGSPKVGIKDLCAGISRSQQSSYIPEVASSVDTNELEVGSSFGEGELDRILSMDTTTDTKKRKRKRSMLRALMARAERQWGIRGSRSLSPSLIMRGKVEEKYREMQTLCQP
mmetsp:Transcript_109951/g.190255  ORF Transcript_109951/g.190255 Transcript_109951/m.190255 type:complete len:253 (+) Transcript_109951:1-759(+)